MQLSAWRPSAPGWPRQRRLARNWTSPGPRCSHWAGESPGRNRMPHCGVSSVSGETRGVVRVSLTRQAARASRTGRPGAETAVRGRRPRKAGVCHGCGGKAEAAADPDGGVRGSGHDGARCLDRERRPAVYSARAPPLACGSGVGGECLCPGAGRIDPLWGCTGGSFRPQAGLHGRCRRLHAGLGRLCPFGFGRDADRLPGGPGNWRRRHVVPDPFADLRGVSAGGKGGSDRALGCGKRPGRGGRQRARRVASRRVPLVIDLLGQRPDRGTDRGHLGGSSRGVPRARASSFRQHGCRAEYFRSFPAHLPATSWWVWASL